MKTLAFRTKNFILGEEKERIEELAEKSKDQVLQSIKHGIINAYKESKMSDMLFGVAEVNALGYHINLGKYDSEILELTLNKLGFDFEMQKNGIYYITFNNDVNHNELIAEITAEVDKFYKNEITSANEAVETFFNLVSNHEFKYDVENGNVKIEVRMPVETLHCQFKSVVEKTLREYNFKVLNLYSLGGDNYKSVWEVMLNC